MLSQNSKSILREKLPSVIRTLAIGTLDDESLIFAGLQDKILYVLTKTSRIIQEIPFPNWVRSIKTADLTGDGNSEIIVGSGDSQIHILRYLDEGYDLVAETSFGDFVDSVDTADLTGDGRQEIVGGSWDKTVKTFGFDPETNSLEELWSREFETGVTGTVIADTDWDGQKEIVVLLKSEGMAILNGTDGTPLINCVSGDQFTAVVVGSLDRTGYPYVVAGTNKNDIYIFDYTGTLVLTLDFPSRITALAIGDIDGMGHNELIVGCGDKHLYTYEVGDGSATSLELKWKNKVPGVINTILINDINNDGKQEIIYGGYDCALTFIQDYNYDIKTALEIPMPELFVTPFSEGVITNSSPMSVSLEPEVVIPTIEPAVLTGKKPISVKNVLTVISAEDDLLARAEKILVSRRYFPNKAALINAFREEGIPEIEIVPTVDYFKSKSFLAYQRSTPRGYHYTHPDMPVKSKFVSSAQEQSGSPAKGPMARVEMKAGIDSAVIHSALGIFKEHSLFSSKAKVIEAFSQANIDSPEAVLNLLKKQGSIQYSRSTPRGYHYVDPSQPRVDTGSSKAKTPKAKTRTPKIVLDDSLKQEIRTIFTDSPVVPSKKELLDHFNSDIHLPTGISGEKLLELCKKDHLIIYSRSTPRWYSMVE